MDKTGVNVGIIGFGVVGSATAHRLNEIGNEVYVSDIKQPKEMIDWSEDFRYRNPYMLNETDATFLALPTPSTEEILYKHMTEDQRLHAVEGRRNESLDTSLYNQLVEPLGKQLKEHDDYHIFIIRSTVAPGTTLRFGEDLEAISGKKLGSDYGVGMVPEFLRAFNNIEDEKNAKMIVAGSLDDKTYQLLEQIYQNVPPNDAGESRLFKATIEEAELSKLESNALNAIRISEHNARLTMYEMLKERLGMDIDYDRMTKIFMNVTETFQNPMYGTTAGVFYAGTCLKKDPGALHSWLEDENRIYNPFSELLDWSGKVNTSLQKRILNDHKFPSTLKNGVPERLKGRHHESYDNIYKVENALKEGKPRK